jgi:hypothetical protein
MLGTFTKLIWNFPFDKRIESGRPAYPPLELFRQQYT